MMRRHEIKKNVRTDPIIQKRMREKWERITNCKKEESLTFRNKQGPVDMRDQIKAALVAMDNLKQMLVVAGQCP